MTTSVISLFKCFPSFQILEIFNHFNLANFNYHLEIYWKCNITYCANKILRVEKLSMIRKTIHIINHQRLVVTLENRILWYLLIFNVHMSHYYYWLLIKKMLCIIFLSLFCFLFFADLKKKGISNIDNNMIVYEDIEKRVCLTKGCIQAANNLVRIHFPVKFF